MKHIFFTHSNITSIVINETIESLLNNGENVIVITRRGTDWPIISNETVIDFSKMIISSLCSSAVIKHIITLSTCVDSIINKEDFLLYLPTSYDEVYYFFQKSKFCKGYYYIEEGVLAYKSLNFVREDKNLFKRGIKHLLGYYPDHYFFDDRFIGTISISEKAFQWNQRKRIVNNSETYFKRACNNQRSYSKIVVFGYLSGDVSFYKSAVETIIQNNGGDITNIAIKFHPRSNFVEPQKKNEIIQYILSFSPNAVILENEYVLEKAIFDKIVIICIQVTSSVLFYNLLMGNKCYLYRKAIDGSVDELAFDSISDYLTFNPSISI